MSDSNDNLTLRRLDDIRELLKVLPHMQRDIEDIKLQLRSIHADIGELRSMTRSDNSNLKALSARVEIIESRP